MNQIPEPMTIGVAALAAWIAWKLIKPIVKFLALLGVLIVLLVTLTFGDGQHPSISPSECPIPALCGPQGR